MADTITGDEEATRLGGQKVCFGTDDFGIEV